MHICSFLRQGKGNHKSASIGDNPEADETPALRLAAPRLKFFVLYVRSGKLTGQGCSVARTLEIVLDPLLISQQSLHLGMTM
jgi:hypothetical protein